MKRAVFLKDIFTKDWQLKLLAFFISVGLWLYVNYGNYVPIEVYKTVHVKHKSQDYVYIVEPKNVILSVMVVDRVLNSKTLRDTKAYIDARTLKNGMNIAKVNIEAPILFLVKQNLSKPTYVRVFVKKKQ
jgi:YbbR domain-containing protein